MDVRWGEWLREMLKAGELIRILLQLVTFAVSVFTGMVLAGIDRRGRENNFVWKIGFAAGFSLTLFVYAQLMRIVLSPLFGRFVWLVPLLVMAGGAVLCLFLHFSLIPRDVSMILGVDRERRRRLTVNLAVLVAVQTALLAGLFFLWFWLPHCERTMAAGLLALTTLALLCFGYFFHLSISSGFDWVKALIDQEYQRELQDFMQIIRAQRHDFNLHLQTVSGLIEQGRYDECHAYIGTLVGNASRMNDLLPIRNPVVSALVHAFVERASQEGVRLDVTVKDSMEAIGCSAYEMNTVIGNLLKNAIEETREKEPDLRYIKLLLMRRSRCTIIRVSNPCDKSEEELAAVFTPGYTTKKAHEGIGLVTVRKICVKYGGTVYIEHEDGVLHMIAKIPCASRL